MVCIVMGRLLWLGVVVTGRRVGANSDVPDSGPPFGRSPAAILAQLEQRGLFGPPRRRELLLPQLHQVAPQVAFAVDLEMAHRVCPARSASTKNAIGPAAELAGSDRGSELTCGERERRRQGMIRYPL
jgi:hypothetical protein